MKVEVVVLGWPIVTGWVVLTQGWERADRAVAGVTRTRMRAVEVVGMTGTTSGLGIGLGWVAILGYNVCSKKSWEVCTRTSQYSMVGGLGTSWVTLTRSVCTDQV